MGTSDERPSDEQLWSWVDRSAPELEEHLEAHPEDQGRVDGLRAAIGRLEAFDPESDIPQKVGKFHIRRLLGRGGMGVVYDAEQEHPRRRVALKVLPSEFASEERRLDLFRREADALARLSHPGIAAVYEVGSGAGARPYIAMERVEGRPLDLFVKEERPSRREKISLARKVCAAVGHAHDHGVAHRDIKPHNILVREDGEPVVVDFGLARIEEEGLTRASLTGSSGSMVGTLPYMSPEQVSGGPGVGPHSDVYSLGVLLYELVVGTRPHQLEGLTLIEAASAIQKAPPSVRGVRGDLRSVVIKALEKDPRRRYSSAGGLAADLQRYLDGRMVEAQRPGRLRSTLMFLRRHWVATSFSAVAFALLIALLFPVRVPVPLFGDWIQGAPFEELRWVGDTPQVRIDESWYRLVAVEDLKSSYIVGFCQQHTEGRWRKRFSEDLVQVIHRLGSWHVREVDLTLRDLSTGDLVVRNDVPLSRKWRENIWLSRYTWPWESQRNSADGIVVSYVGEEWQLLALDNLTLADAEDDLSRERLYDVYCDRVGHSPGARIDLTLRNVESGAIRSFTDVDRLGGTREGSR